MSSIRSHTLLTFRALRPYPARRLLSTTVTNRADTLRDRPSQPIYEGGDLGSAAGEEEPKKRGSIRNAYGSPDPILSQNYAWPGC